MHQVAKQLAAEPALAQHGQTSADKWERWQRSQAEANAGGRKQQREQVFPEWRKATLIK